MESIYLKKEHEMEMTFSIHLKESRSPTREAFCAGNQGCDITALLLWFVAVYISVMWTSENSEINWETEFFHGIGMLRVVRIPLFENKNVFFCNFRVVLPHFYFSVCIMLYFPLSYFISVLFRTWWHIRFRFFREFRHSYLQK